MALSLCEIEVSTPDNNSTAFVSKFDDNVRVGPEGAKGGKFGRREVGMGEGGRKIEKANVPSIVPNEKIEGR